MERKSFGRRADRLHRGQAAHRSPPSGSRQPEPAYLSSREELDKLIKFLKMLVTQTEASFP